jgi:hypothetical protein
MLVGERVIKQAVQEGLPISLLITKVGRSGSLGRGAGLSGQQCPQHRWLPGAAPEVISGSWFLLLGGPAYKEMHTAHQLK